MTSDGEMTEMKIVDLENIFGLSSGVSPSINKFFLFFLCVFWFYGNHITADSRMCPFISAALVVPVQKTNIDGDFESAVVFNFVVVCTPSIPIYWSF